MNVSESNAVVAVSRYLLGRSTRSDEEILECLRFLNERATATLKCGLRATEIDESWPTRRVLPTPAHDAETGAETGAVADVAEVEGDAPADGDSVQLDAAPEIPAMRSQEPTPIFREPTPVLRKHGDDAPVVTVAASECTDHRCVDGVTMCQGCNGYGVLRHNGRKFTLRGKGKHITPNSPRHDGCGGTGLAVCGCRPLDADTLASLGLPDLEIAS